MTTLKFQWFMKLLKFLSWCYVDQYRSKTTSESVFESSTNFYFSELVLDKYSASLIRTYFRWSRGLTVGMYDMWQMCYWRAASLWLWLIQSVKRRFMFWGAYIFSLSKCYILIYKCTNLVTPGWKTTLLVVGTPSGSLWVCSWGKPISLRITHWLWII